MGVGEWGGGGTGCKKRVHFEKYTSNFNSRIIFKVFSHHLLSDLVEVGISYLSPTVEI